jgi:hypothetical protein
MHVFFLHKAENFKHDIDLASKILWSQNKSTRVKLNKFFLRKRFRAKVVETTIRICNQVIDTYVLITKQNDLLVI